MTTPGTTEPAIARRALTTAFLAIVLLLVAGYAVTASVALQQIEAAQGGALLATIRSASARGLDTLATGTIRTAMTASPLEQRTVNVAMAREAREAREQDNTRIAVWLMLLSRLGWRDTPALQNLLYAAALNRDLPAILDVSDGLLRRQKLMDQVIPVLALVEADPRLREPLAARLAARPSWRSTYLSSTGALRTRDQMLGRFAMLRQLQLAGARLDPGEVIPSINALDQGDLPAYGFALWQSIRGQATRPLDDTNFALASRYNSNDGSVPYQWQTMSGDGFRADVSQDSGHPQLSIDWDGRGIPVFAQQRTSAAQGRYALALVAAPRDVDALSAVVFRLLCGGTTTAFRPVAPLHYVTDAAISCAYPSLQIAGDIQPSVKPREFAIDRITMTPLASEVRR